MHRLATFLSFVEVLVSGCTDSPRSVPFAILADAGRSSNDGRVDAGTAGEGGFVVDGPKHRDGDQPLEAGLDSSPSGPVELPSPDAAGDAVPPDPAFSSEGWGRVEAGCFEIGGPGGPWVAVTRPFEIRRWETTRAEWEHVGYHTDMVGCPEGACPSLPVVNEPWTVVLHFCNDASAQEGLPPCYRLLDCGRRWEDCSNPGFVGFDCAGLRLPTDGEWELAARAGETAELYGSLDDIAWSSRNTVLFESVAQLRPNAGGLFDVVGNVGELVMDAYDRDGLGGVDPVRVREPTSGPHVTVRGGDSSVWPWMLGLSFRSAAGTTEQNVRVGFRLVRTLLGNGLTDAEAEACLRRAPSLARGRPSRAFCQRFNECLYASGCVGSFGDECTGELAQALVAVEPDADCSDVLDAVFMAIPDLFAICERL